MNTKLLLFIFLLLSCRVANAQYGTQYFDGRDTLPYSVQVRLDTGIANVWQIRPPRKMLFTQAATLPNALVTDTIHPYPVNDTCSVTFVVRTQYSPLIAVQWKQKLDLDSAGDIGVVEFSLDSGVSWQSAFNNNYVHNFYGYQAGNIDTVPSGEVGFSGTDTTWRDLWLCYPIPFAQARDIYCRFTLKTDSVDSTHDGWMIDNLSAHQTFIHPIKEVADDPFLKVYPRLTNGLVYIQSKATQDPLTVLGADLIDEKGSVVEKYEINSNSSSITIGTVPNGWYVLRVNTTLKPMIYNLMLKRE